MEYEITKSKIKQIIPAPEKMRLIFEDCESETNYKYYPVVCLALIEYENGDTEIIPMDISDGDIYNPETTFNYKGTEFIE
jgi:hypothetical protein